MTIAHRMRNCQLYLIVKLIGIILIVSLNSHTVNLKMVDVNGKNGRTSLFLRKLTIDCV